MLGSRSLGVALCVPFALATGCETLLGLRETEATRDARPSATAAAGGSDDAGSGAEAGAADQGGREASSAAGGETTAGRGGMPAGPLDGDAGGGGSSAGDGGESDRGGRSATDGTGGTEAAGVGGTGGNKNVAGAAGTGLGGNGGAAAGGAGMSAAGGAGHVTLGGAIAATDGSCLAIAQTTGVVVNDPTVVHGDCEDGPAQSWAFDEQAHLHAAVDDAFLEVNGAAWTSGKIVRVAAPVAPAADHQQWAFDGVQLVNLGGLCVDVPFGSFFNGATVQVFTCGHDDSQTWSVTALGQIRHGSSCLDLPGESMTPGTRIQIFACYDDPPDNQRFVLEHGRLEPRGSGNCVGLAGDPTGVGTSLEVQTCDTSELSPVGQSFWLVGPIMNRGQCLDSGPPNAGWGDPVALEPCAGTPQQTWTWAF
jgi:hypothetical protein